jgi:hypothetical protein
MADLETGSLSYLHNRQKAHGLGKGDQTLPEPALPDHYLDLGKRQGIFQGKRPAARTA